MSFSKKVIRLITPTILLLSTFVTLETSAQAASGLDYFFKAESGATAQMTQTPFTTGTCHVSRGDFNQNWGNGSPGGTCPTEGFTLYGQGFIKAPAAGTVTFYSSTDDGFVLKINDQTVISDLTDHGLGNPYNATGSISMTAGATYPIKFWFHENFGAAAMTLRWSYPGQSEPVLVPLSSLDTENAPQDVQNPVVVVGSGTLSSPTVEAGQSFTISYRITDDVACCNQHDVLFYNTQGQVAFSAPSSKISGTQTDVTYRAQVSVGTGIAPGEYLAKTQTTDLAGKFSFLQEIGSIQVTAAVPPSPTPVLSTATSTSDGFTFLITNYDSGFTWNATTTSGTANVNASGLVTVTGLQALGSATVTVTSSKTGFTNGQATRVGAALDGDPSAVTPAFTAVPLVAGSTNTTFATSVLDGCDAQISNFNNRLTWSGSSPIPGSTVVISNTGLIQVRGLGSQNTTRVTIVNRGANNTTGQANFDCVSWYPTLGIQSTTTSTISLRTNYLAGITYDLIASSGTVTNSQNGTITISNLKSGVDVSLTVKAYTGATLIWPKSGQGSGIFPLGRTQVGTTQAPLNFMAPVSLQTNTPVQLSASGGSGSGLISFSTTTPNICSISGNTLTPRIVGACVVTATKAGDSTYSEITVTSTITVSEFGLPTVNISAPSSSSIVTGSFSVTATASVANPASTARLVAACLLIDGVNTTAAAVNNSPTYWTTGLTNRGPSANCFDVRSLTTATLAWNLDATTWTNGNHQIGIKVFDSAGKESATASITFRVEIGVPTVTVTAPSSNSTVSGAFSVTASAAIASGSTARLVAACLLIDGVNTTAAAVNNSPAYWSNGLTNRGPSANCFDVRSLASATLAWNLDATTWTNGNHQIGIKVFDGAGKESVLVSIPIRVNVGVPTVTITSPAARATVTGNFTLSATAAIASGSTARLVAACLLIDGVNTTAAAVNNSPTYWSNGLTNRGPSANCFDVRSLTTATLAWNLDATTWSNGDRQVAVKVFDSTGKESSLASIQLTVTNPAPEITSLSPKDASILYGNFDIDVRWTSATAVTHVGINLPCANLPYRVYSENPNVKNLPSGYVFMNVSSLRNLSFTCTIDAASQIGKEIRVSKKLGVIIVDRAGQFDEAESSLLLMSPKPTLEIRSPALNQGVKGELLIEAWARSPAESKRQITFIGISESSAKPSFNNNRSSYGSQMPSKYTPYRVESSTSGEWLNFIWKLDLTDFKAGLRTIEVATQDSNGDVVEQAIQFLVQEPEVQLSFIKPTLNQVFPGDLEIRVRAKADPLTNFRIKVIAIDFKEVEPTFAGYQISEWQSKVPRNFRAWELDSRNQPDEYIWKAEAGSVPNGTYTLTVIAFDEKNYSKSQTISFEVNTPNPEVRITNPTASIIGTQPIDFTMSVDIPKIANADVELVGINITDAVPGFVAQPVRLTDNNQLRNFVFWKVDSAKSYTWKLNPTSWGDGNRSVSVLVLDSNKRLGQASFTLHKAPSATWKFEVKDPPVLGKSVAIGVSMQTSSQRRVEPAVAARLQQATSPKGPWTDSGLLTFDNAGIAAGRVIVTTPMYVRVYHDVLDAVQPGASEPFRIVNVPDPTRRISNKSTGETNEDGSIPSVTCTPPQRVALNARLTVACTAVDVQDPAQPIQIYLQQGKSFKKIGSARMSGNLISFTTTLKRAGKYIFEVRGEATAKNFTQWRSNRITINVKK
jgi:uncharacterized membrane protein YphA (DoxX/SURF4 family)